MDLQQQRPPYGLRNNALLCQSQRQSDSCVCEWAKTAHVPSVGHSRNSGAGPERIWVWHVDYGHPRSVMMRQCERSLAVQHIAGGGVFWWESLSFRADVLVFLIVNTIFYVSRLLQDDCEAGCFTEECTREKINGKLCLKFAYRIVNWIL